MRYVKRHLEAVDEMPDWVTQRNHIVALLEIADSFVDQAADDWDGRTLAIFAYLMAAWNHRPELTEWWATRVLQMARDVPVEELPPPPSSTEEVTMRMFRRRHADKRNT
jgi:hypothetical protein